MIDYIQVSVAYVGPEGQALRNLEARTGTGAEEAIKQSGILGQFPEIDLATNKIGIFGKLVKPDQELHDGDRVEIYRPLIADPKEARKRRAAGSSQGT
ncbi:RnfH family protein [Thiorhodococcus mannitoliphagus]|uniref:UPF0125 protein G3480_10095 n=1 Tax=Thiorhodococcus mannitoliphagus TaxID=329406 RepID=A0A6P1DVE0_9GAMM|nr:RnfH family protein [Thiorhodococcus mannitoliphagus]